MRFIVFDQWTTINSLMSTLVLLGVLLYVVEVLWGAAADGGCMHGCLFVSGYSIVSLPTVAFVGHDQRQQDVDGHDCAIVEAVVDAWASEWRWQLVGCVTSRLKRPVATQFTTARQPHPLILIERLRAVARHDLVVPLTKSPSDFTYNTLGVRNPPCFVSRDSDHARYASLVLLGAIGSRRGNHPADGLYLPIIFTFRSNLTV
ncbi:hypothetical protein MUK42_24209 [Musa troglodytarum]|uniref:Uncharacterized protein n=1 Tax=Musa troglodytarum TaxID=320322 RepID=A0A9E7FLS3_9LILI|nr:hypothetical protein MUK42_24209 [Musa troglodytarum]